MDVSNFALRRAQFKKALDADAARGVRRAAADEVRRKSKVDRYARTRVLHKQRVDKPATSAPPAALTPFAKPPGAVPKSLSAIAAHDPHFVPYSPAQFGRDFQEVRAALENKDAAALAGAFGALLPIFKRWTAWSMDGDGDGADGDVVMVSMAKLAAPGLVNMIPVLNCEEGQDCLFHLLQVLTNMLVPPEAFAAMRATDLLPQLSSVIRMCNRGPQHRVVAQAAWVLVNYGLNDACSAEELWTSPARPMDAVLLAIHAAPSSMVGMNRLVNALTCALRVKPSVEVATARMTSVVPLLVHVAQGADPRHDGLCRREACWGLAMLADERELYVHTLLHKLGALQAAFNILSSVSEPDALKQPCEILIGHFCASESDLPAQWLVAMGLPALLDALARRKQSRYNNNLAWMLSNLLAADFDTQMAIYAVPGLLERVFAWVADEDKALPVRRDALWCATNAVSMFPDAVVERWASLGSHICAGACSVFHVGWADGHETEVNNALQMVQELVAHSPTIVLPTFTAHDLLPALQATMARFAQSPVGQNATLLCRELMKHSGVSPAGAWAGANPPHAAAGPV